MCDEGYYNKDPLGLDCEACHSSCKTCSGPSSEQCTSCEDSFLQNGVCGPCPDSTFLVGNLCVDCPELCTACQDSSICSECIENASLGNDNLCHCKEGFFRRGGVCVYDELYASLEVKDHRNIHIYFSRPLKNDLKESDISVEFKNDIKFSYSMEKFNSANYRVSLRFKQSEVKEREEFYVGFKNASSICSSDETCLSYSSKKLKGFSPKYSQEAEKDSEELRALEAFTYGSMIALVSVGLLSAYGSAMWFFFSTIQILAFLPISNSRLTPKITEFLKGLRYFDYLFNLFDLIFDAEKNPNPHYHAEKYGFESNYFLLIAGETLTTLLLFIALLPFVWMFSKCKYKSIKKIFKKRLSDYKYGLLIRFWVQAYLEFAVGGVNQVLETPETTFGAIFNFAVACFFNVLLVVSPVFVLKFIKKHLEAIKEAQEDSEIAKKWGSLFYEFKPDSSIYALGFYAFFFVRRALYALNLYLMSDYPLLQCIANILLMLSFSVYMLVAKPFKDSILQFSNTVTEFGLFLIFSTVTYYVLWEDSDYERLMED